MDHRARDRGDPRAAAGDPGARRRVWNDRAGSRHRAARAAREAPRARALRALATPRPARGGDRRGGAVRGFGVTSREMEEGTMQRRKLLAALAATLAVTALPASAQSPRLPGG